MRMVNTNLTGIFCEIDVLPDNISVNFSMEDIQKNVHRLTNQMWKLIPMREHEEDWQKQLDTVYVEVAGLNSIIQGPVLLQLLSKLEGLRIVESSFELYRKTIFECISLLQELNHGRL